MSATAGPVHEMQAPPPLVSNSESTEPVAGSADGTPTSATVPTMGLSVQGTTASSSLPESIQSTVAASGTPAQSSLSQTGSLVKQNEPAQDSVRAKFTSSSGYVVPAPSFSYNVVPRMNSTPSNAQQPSSSPAFKWTPPMPAAALQPPVPGQFLGNRPFSFSVVPHANVVPASGQQIQLETAPVQVQFQGGRFTPSSASLQPPIPRQPIRAAFVPGAVSSNSPAPTQFPLSVPRGDATKQRNFLFSGNNQLLTAEKSETTPSTEKQNTSDAVAMVTTSTSSSLASSFSVQTSHCLPSSTSMAPGTSVNSSSTSMSIPAAPSFTVHAEIPSSDRFQAFLGISNSAVVSNAATIKPTATSSFSPLKPIVPLPATLPPTIPVPVPVPVHQNLQQPTNPVYALQPTMAPSPQFFWSHPPQAGQMQHVPFSPYPGYLPAPFPQSVQGIPPTVPSVFVQPPGVSPVVSQVEPTTGCLHPESSSIGELPSSDIDQGKKSIIADKAERDTNNEIENAWTSHKTETGAVYYYNSITGKSTYEKPSSFKGEQEKATNQSGPVSWEKLPGTDWTLVTTNDGRKYYYDTKNKVSSWHAPAEVAELRKGQEINSTEGNEAPPEAGMQGDKVFASVSIDTPAAQTGGRESVALRSGQPVPSSALDLIKKKLLPETGSPITSPHSTSGPTASDTNGLKAVESAVKGQKPAISKEKAKDAAGDANMSDSSSESDDEESGPSKEECIIKFKEMLKERGVAPFSKWEKELPKIVFDPRFKGVPSHSTRRALFEHYVRTRAEEERKEKRAAQKAALDAFKQLLEEATEDIDHKTDYHSFRKKWGGDPRFEAIDRKERELLLNEKVKAADERIKALRMAASSSFKCMLRDNQNITLNSRWSRVKDSFREDPRYKVVKHEDRELLFNEYIAELKAAEEEAERSAKAKRDEQEKLKERERELRKRKEREEQEMERVKIKVRRKEVEYTYRALLVEMIKDPKATWTESKPKLEKDTQGRLTNPDLAPEDAEKLFREHVKDLHERCVNDYRSLLAEVITAEAADAAKDDGKTILTSWSEAKRLLKADARYTKLPSKDRESLWHRHAEDLLRKHKSSLPPKEKLDKDGKNKLSSAEHSKKSPRRSPHRSHVRR
ncbi:pre-mRNA-processing protein 40C-like isoform X1 [Zingiber officinale]|uniref:pre-mRNA-processing protein 40C-like isoform X1 n=1 Tax=Zingiber officinale TaxID=94328 RepID=UPI001C4C98F3|nr:pre-mRNA-processing protein 40C-like isoform X1 [Zingiber officinale]